MNNSIKGIALFGAVVAAVVLIYSLVGIGYRNNGIELQNSIKAHQTACKVTFDETWKVIQSQAQVTGKYAEDFKQAYTDLMHERYAGGIGKFMGMITESNPNLDSTIYTNLQNTIKSARAKFANEQKMLVAKNQSYEDLRLTFPGSWFLSDQSKFGEMEIVIVTSEKTSTAFESGQENNIDLF